MWMCPGRGGVAVEKLQVLPHFQQAKQSAGPISQSGIWEERGKRMKGRKIS